MERDGLACLPGGLLLVTPDRLTAELEAQAQAARGDTSPGGKEVTADERSAMQTHAEGRIRSFYERFLKATPESSPAFPQLGACRRNAGVGLRKASESARVLVDAVLQPPAAPSEPTPARGRGPLIDV